MTERLPSRNGGNAQPINGQREILYHQATLEAPISSTEESLIHDPRHQPQ